jgi:hypothetical protein
MLLLALSSSYPRTRKGLSFVWVAHKGEVTGGEGSGGGEAVRRWRGRCGCATGERKGNGENPI